MKALSVLLSLSLISCVIAQERIPLITTFSGGRNATLPDPDSDPTYLWPAAIEGEMPDVQALESSMVDAATKTAAVSGDWSSTTTWGGSVPGAADTVRIPSGIQVIYNVESDVALKDVLVQGTLTWARNIDTKMTVETLFVTGSIDMGTASSPIPESSVEGKPRTHILFEGVNPGTTHRLGLVTKGPVRIHGAEKPEKLRINGDALTGATTISLIGDVTKWRVGDKIVVVAMSDAGEGDTDPQYTGPTGYYREGGQAPEGGSTGHRVGDWAFLGYKRSHDEVRTITAINGQTITVDSALVYDHISHSANLPRGQTVDIPAIVASLSRSIRMESANPTGHRAHAMFMYSDDVQVRWAEALNMGRTRQDPSLAAVNNNALTEAGGTSVMDANNVRGRYPWHAHLTGPNFARNMVIFEGLTAWAPTAEVPQPGWGIVQHGSRAAIEKCVVYNVRGAGIVSELGNEIGQWINNVVCWCRGDGFSYGWGKRGEGIENHQGSAGVAYENQARQILQQNNWATSSHIGWSYLQQTRNANTRTPEHRSLRLVDPWVGGGRPGIGDMNEGYGVEQAQIPDWNDNVCVGVGDGFFVAHRQFTNRQEQSPMISRGYRCIGCRKAVNIQNYSFWYSFYDFVWVDGPGGAAIQYGDKTAAFNHANGYIRGYSSAASIKGYNVDGWFAQIDHDFTSETPFNVQTLTISANNYNDPPSHPLYQHSLRMGGWVMLGNNQIRPRPSTYKADNEISLEPATWEITADFGNRVLSATEARVGAASFRGFITDGFGTRPYPHWSWFDSAADEKVFTVQESTETPRRIVERNGCFFDTADDKWKSRMYFVDHNRLTGDYIIIDLDVELTNFETSFLEANTIVPSPPVLPLVPESISAGTSNPTESTGQTTAGTSQTTTGTNGQTDSNGQTDDMESVAARFAACIFMAALASMLLAM